MNKRLEDRAKKFAELPYTLRISEDKTTDGEIVFLAMHPELIGCMAQGVSVKEATENLKEVTFEYILSLLEDKVPVPVPSARLTKTTLQTRVYLNNTVIGSKSFIDTLSEVVQPCTGQEISVVELVR